LATSLITVSLVNKYGSDYSYKIIKWLLAGSFIVIVTVWFGGEGFNTFGKRLPDNNGGGLIGNSSIAAPYFVFAFFSGLYLLFVKNINKYWKIFIALTIGLILFSPLFINLYGLFNHDSLLGSARGALLGILIGFGVIVLGYLALSKKKIIRIFGIVSILISLAVFAVGWSNLMKPGTFLHEKFSAAASSGTRFIFWDIAQKSMNDHPYFGYGPENYLIAFQSHFNAKILNREYGSEGWNDRAHNIYYDTGASGGYPAIALYFIFIFSILYFVYKANEEGRLSKVGASVLWALLVAYVFQNLFVFDSNISIFYLNVILGLILGLFGDNQVEIIVKNKKNKKNEDPSFNIMMGLLLTAISIFSLYNFSISPANKSKLYRSASKPISTKSRQLIYDKLLKGSSVGIDRENGVLADNFYKNYMKEFTEMKDGKKNIPSFDLEIKNLLEYLEKVNKLNSYDYRLNINIIHLYSLYYNVTGTSPDLDESNHMMKILKHANELSPTNPQVYWRMAQVYAWQNNVKGVLDSYEKAVEIEPTVPNSHRLLILFAKNMGNKKLYEELLLRAEKDIPGFVLD
jgi:hypothetical protein